MTVGVVTDSAAALPADLAAEAGIGVAQLWLTLGGRTLKDAEVSREELVSRLDAGETVTTSGPPPGEFSAAIRERQAGDGVLVLTVAASMSSTYKAAQAGAREVGGPVRVVDSGTAAGGQGLAALAAARAAAGGASLEEVETVARRVIERVRLVATLESLDYLARSGRVPGIANWAGKRLNVAPLFELRAGQARSLRPALGRDAALNRIISVWARSREPGARLHVAALHALAPEEAERLLDRVRSAVKPDTAFVAEFTAVMVVHTGPRLVGLSWWWEPASEPPA